MNMALITEPYKTNPSTVHNPELESGYYSLDALAQLKSMSVLDLFRVYSIEHNVAEDGKVFYNIATITIH